MAKAGGVGCGLCRESEEEDGGQDVLRPIRPVRNHPQTLPAATVTETRLMRLALLVRHIPDPAHEGRGAFEEVGGGLERASSKSSDESHGRKSMKKKADAMYGF